MKRFSWRRAAALLTALAMCLSLVTLPAMADESAAEGSFVNVSEDGGENCINLTEALSLIHISEPT